ncbi:MAG: hypothetical protein J5885_03825 [Clostridia bacterium]|nr:hypothetical protein [Clostridia bacterium]
MANHNFSFAGGELLSKMGASWFVSYSYHEKIDPTELNWQNVSPKSIQSRRSVFKRSTSYHHFWLNQVLKMEDTNIEKPQNKVGLSANEVKKMAKKLLPIT